MNVASLIRVDYKIFRDRSRFLTTTELSKIANALGEIGRGDRWACTPRMHRKLALMLDAQIRGLAAQYGGGAA